ncbi:MAG: amino acid adenylation domain-containing protein, partial [Gammaproteobacteria bacterium]|nr:amino acid adenylation domain-containing protein [Gammaproteobacteria bacterium]
MNAVILAASEYAKIFWLAAQRLPADAQFKYHIYGLYHFSNDLDLARLTHALQVTINTNYNLRSNFFYAENQLKQIIHSHSDVNFIQHNVATEQEAEQVIAEGVTKPFDLAKDPLHRFILVKIKGSAIYKILAVLHHITIDGTQFGSLNAQIQDHYFNPKSLELTDQASIAKFEEYLLWEQEQMQKIDLKQIIEKLKDYPLIPALPCLSGSERQQAKKVIANKYVLAPNLYQKLKTIAKQHNFSVFNFIKTAWAALIAHYCNQNKIIVSYAFNTRRAKFRDIKGCFVNTIPDALDLNFSTDELMQIAKQEFINSRANLFAPIGSIVNALSATNLNDIAVVYAEFVPTQLVIAKASAPIQVDQIGDSKILLRFYEAAEEIPYQILTLENFLPDELIKRMPAHFEVLLENMLDNLEAKLITLNILTTQEQQLLRTFNQTEQAFSEHKTIHELFEEQVTNTPQNIAAVFEGRELTYQELNAKANQLARHIRKQYQELKPDTLIALCLDRSLEMIIAILAVLKAGGAYVPIDPDCPLERISFILKDTQAKLLITQEHLQPKLKKHKIDVVVIDNAEIQHQLNYYQAHSLTPKAQSNNLAYVIYTSGTTGDPKGVLQTQHNVIRLFASTAKYFQFNSKDTWTLFHSYIFDFTVWELWGALLYGGKLVIPNYFATRDTTLFYALCEKYKVSVLSQTPAAFYQFIAEDLNQAETKLNNLRYVIFGGEALNIAQLTNWINKYGYQKPKLINMYGITETTVHVTLKELTKADLAQGYKSNIGKHLPDLTTYILNANLQLVPIGVIGELYVGGAGLARGYLNKPELTKERFIENPFATQADKERGYTRLYKTGDLARWLENGDIEYIGRNDFQVKIRGFRIELGEIESAISKIKGIKQVTVQAREKATAAGINKYLVAYYIKDKEAKVTADLINKEIIKTLPEYMVPQTFVELKSFPLTVNGKLDRKALPDPEHKLETTYTPPTSELEAKLCVIWQEVLGLEKVGINDDFFRLGGNSLLAIQAAYKMSKLLNKHIGVAEILEYKNITNILNQTLGLQTIYIPKTKVVKPQLSFAQERLWFIDQYEQGTNAYNIPISLKLNSSTKIDALLRALNAVVQRQEILRTIFKLDEKNGKYYQEVLATKLAITKRSYKSQQDIEHQILKDSGYIFNLKQELPIKIWLYQKTRQPSYLLINVHHIAFDGISIEILLKELTNLYNHYTKHTKLDLPELEIQYKDFAVWQREYLSGERLETELAYWKKQLLGFETLKLPIDKIRPKQVTYQGQKIKFELCSREQSLELRNLAKEQGVTLYTVLLAIFNILLFKYTNQEDVIIGTPGANRNYHQLENLIGFFINSLAIRTKIQPNQKLEELIQEVQHTLIEAQAHQDLPFEKLVEELNVEKDTARHPIFQV